MSGNRSIGHDARGGHLARAREALDHPTGPATAAGQALYDAWITHTDDSWTLDDMKSAILAIEAEAIAEGEGTVWHYCDFDSRHHRAAEAAPDLRAVLEAAEYALNLALGATYDDRTWMDEAMEALEAVRAALAAPAADGLDVERLWRVLEGWGVIENGTWVSFQHADVEKIAAAYAADSEDE